jgi:hypothetical protein
MRHGPASTLPVLTVTCALSCSMSLASVTEDAADADGRLAFRGLFGKYKVVVQHEGSQRAFEIHVQKGADNKFVLTFE